MHDSIWIGDFGDEYTNRNLSSETNIIDRTKLLRNIFKKVRRLSYGGRLLEIGAGGGANLKALRSVMGPNAALCAVEPNASARALLHDGGFDAVEAMADDMPFHDRSFDVSLTCGVLIHIPLCKLGKSLDEIHRVTDRYILCMEYFSPNEEMVPYRGLENALWRRDYGSLFLDRFEDLRCVDYGFAWKRETGLDNLTWWLMERIPC